MSDDPYIAFGLQLGQSEEEAKANRPLLKATVLGVQFGMTAHGIARRNKISLARAERLLAQHKRIYAKFWAGRSAPPNMRARASPWRRGLAGGLVGHRNLASR